MEQSPEVEFRLKRLGTKLALRESNCSLPGLGRHRRSQFRSPVFCVNIGLRLFVPKGVVCLFILNLNWEGKSSNLWVNHFCLGKLVTPATANPMPCKARRSVYVCVYVCVSAHMGMQRAVYNALPSWPLGPKICRSGQVQEERGAGGWSRARAESISICGFLWWREEFPLSPSSVGPEERGALGRPQLSAVREDSASPREERGCSHQEAKQREGPRGRTPHRGAGGAEGRLPCSRRFPGGPPMG